MRVLLLLLALTLSQTTLASARPGYLPGRAERQAGVHVKECGVRSDGTLYAHVAGIPASSTAEEEAPVPYVRFRLWNKTGTLLFDEFVPTLRRKR